MVKYIKGGLRMFLFKAKKQKAVPMDADINTLLMLANSESDPVFRHKLLLRARDINPDDLAVHRALLMLGSLHEIQPNSVDFSKIKCFLIDVFENPEKYNEKEIKNKALEMFYDSQLKLCLKLASDSDVFMREYLEDLFQEYIRIFLAGDSSKVPSLFGLRPRHSIGKYLARPMANIIRNMMSCPYYSLSEQQLSSGQFYRACYRYLSGDMKWLHEELGNEILQHLK